MIRVSLLSTAGLWSCLLSFIWCCIMPLICVWLDRPCTKRSLLPQNLPAAVRITWMQGRESESTRTGSKITRNEVKEEKLGHKDGQRCYFLALQVTGLGATKVRPVEGHLSCFTRLSARWKQEERVRSKNIVSLPGWKSVDGNHICART